MIEFSQVEVDKKIKEMLATQKKPNILICGRTGTGKSSAVNYLFNETVAQVDEKMEPCTRDIKLYRNDTLNIFDSEGYEIGGERQKHYEELLFDDFLSKPERKGLNNPDAVHLVWYAIDGASKRFTDLDEKLINRIKKEGFNVCVLLTKIDELDEKQLKDMMDMMQGLQGIDIFSLSIKARNDEKLAKFCDWDALIDWSCNSLSETLKDRFVMALRGNLDLKRNRACKIVAAAATAAAAAGASPIPFSDAAILVPIQTSMIVGIGLIYNISIGKSAIFSIVSGTSISSLGKSLAGSILKFIPGIGSVIGGVVNASVAASITGGLGYAFSELCFKQCKDSLDGKQPSIDIEKIITAPSFIAEVLKRVKEAKQ